MRTISIVLLIIGAVCFALATLNVGSPRVNLLPAGLLAWILVPLLTLLRVDS